MKIKRFLKIITFIIILNVIFLSLSNISEAKTDSNLEVDTSYDTILLSINKTLEKNEHTEHVDSIIKNAKHDSYSYTLNVFCKENNDKQIMNSKDKRATRIEKLINLHKINFLTANFNLL